MTEFNNNRFSHCQVGVHFFSSSFGFEHGSDQHFFVSQTHKVIFLTIDIRELTVFKGSNSESIFKDGQKIMRTRRTASKGARMAVKTLDDAIPNEEKNLSVHDPLE